MIFLRVCQSVYESDCLFKNPTGNVQGCQFLHIFTTLVIVCCCFFLNIVIYLSRNWYLKVALVCLSLRTNDVEHF